MPRRKTPPAGQLHTVEHPAANEQSGDSRSTTGKSHSNMLVEEITAFIDDPPVATSSAAATLAGAAPHCGAGGVHHGGTAGQPPQEADLQAALDFGADYEPKSTPLLPPQPTTQTLEEIDLGFDFSSEFEKAKVSQTPPGVPASGAKGSEPSDDFDNPATNDTKSRRKEKSWSKTNSKVLRFGYLTGLVAADTLSKNRVPGRDMAKAFCIDAELSRTLDEILEEVGEQLKLDQYMTPVAKLGMLTAGVWVQVSAERGTLGSGTDDSVSSDELS